MLEETEKRGLISGITGVSFIGCFGLKKPERSCPMPPAKVRTHKGGVRNLSGIPLPPSAKLSMRLRGQRNKLVYNGNLLRTRAWEEGGAGRKKICS